MSDSYELAPDLHGGATEANADSHFEGDSVDLGDRPFATRLFAFVSIAYGMALTTVFPVVYETLGDLRSAVAAVVPKGTPFLEQIPALFNERMAYSLVPFVDKVVLAVCLLALWLGYYFLIAKAKDVSGGEYRPSLVMFDLFQGMILLFTAKSISAFSHDVSVEGDWSWLGILACVIAFMIRHAVSHASIRKRGGGVLETGQQYTCRAFVGMGPLLAMTVGASYFGFRQNLDPHRLLDTDRVVRETCSVMALAILASYWVVQAQLKRKPLAVAESCDCWRWAWKKKRLQYVLALVLLGGSSLATYWLGEATLLALGRYRASIPWSIPILIAITVGLLAVWRDGRGIGDVLRPAKRYGDDIKKVLGVLADCFDRSLVGNPNIGYYSVRGGDLSAPVLIGSRGTRCSERAESMGQQAMSAAEQLSAHDEVETVSTCTWYGGDAILLEGDETPPAIALGVKWDLGSGVEHSAIVLCLDVESLAAVDGRRNRDHVHREVERLLELGLEAIRFCSMTNADSDFNVGQVVG